MGSCIFCSDFILGEQIFCNNFLLHRPCNIINFALSLITHMSLILSSTQITLFSLHPQEYNYDSARDRQHLVRFHKEAEARKFNLAKYNGLKESIARLQSEMTFLKSPQFKLPSRTDVAEQSN